MSAELKVVSLPERDIADVPRGLRALADQIEAGEYGDGHALAWVIDCGGSRIELGLLGGTPEPGAVGHLLFGLAARRLEDSALGMA